MRRYLLAALLGCLALVAVQPAPGHAHAVLLESIPAENEVLSASPGEVALRFSEPVTLLPDGLIAIDPAGHRVDLADAGPGESAGWIRVSLSSNLPEGTYLVSWGVISADGHPVRGAFVFHLGAPSAEPPMPTAAAQPPVWVDPFVSGVRLVEYVAVLGTAGIALFLVLVHDGQATERRRLRAATATLTWIAAVTIPFALLAESFRISGSSPSDALGQEQVRLVLESGPGLAAAILAVGCLAVLAVFYGMGRHAIGPLLPGAALMAAASAWRGHSAAVDPAWLGLAANVVHMAAAAAWSGGLAAVAYVAWIRHRRGHDGVRKHLVRFSRVALAAFLTAAIAGITLGLRILPSVDALFDTRYGNLLLAKSVLVVLVLLVATHHRFRALRRPRVPGSVRFTVFAEVAMMVAVVAVTSVLVMRDPNPAPQASAPSASTGFISEGFAGDLHFDLRVDPATPGENTITLEFHAIEADADPATIQRVQLQLVETERDIGPFTIDVEPDAPGVYRHAGSEMQVAGTWRLTVAVRLSDFQEERLSYEFEIR